MCIRGLQRLIDESGENLVVQQLPAFIEEDHDRLPVKQLLDAMEDIEQGRRAGRCVAQHARHVEAENGRHRKRVFRVVEQPTALIRPHPWLQARIEIVIAGAHRTAQQLGELLHGSTFRRRARHLGDRVADDLLLARRVGVSVGSTQHEAEKLEEKIPVARRIGQAQRIEAGRLPGLQNLIAAAKRPHEDIQAAVLVDHHQLGARRDALRLCREKAEQDRLARARGTVQSEIAEVSNMEVEEVGRLRRRLEDAYRRSPMHPASSAARIVMKGGEARHVLR